MGLFSDQCKQNYKGSAFFAQLWQSLLVLGVTVLVCRPALALDIHCPQVQTSLKYLQQHKMASSLQHVQWLIDSKLLQHSKEISHLTNKQLLQYVRRLHMHIEADPEKWHAQMSVQSRGRLMAWWQDRLEGMQRRVAGLGIEVDGMRFHHQRDWVHIMGRAVEQVPATPAAVMLDSDVIIQSDALSGALQLHINNEGVHARMYSPLEQEQRYLDKDFLQALPQELFAWTAVHIHDNNRHVVQALIETLDDVMHMAASEQLRAYTANMLESYTGELFLGFTNIDHDFEFVLACEKNNSIPLNIMKSGLDEEKMIYVMRGDKRLVLAHNARIARQLSGDQEVAFPQQIPERILQHEQLASAAYVDTVSLAQLYYKALPMLRHYSDRIGTQEFNMLRNSLREMLPQSQAMLLCTYAADEQLVTDARHIGQAGIIGLGMSLCYRYAASERLNESQFVLQAFERIQQQREQEKGWPRRMSYQKGAMDLCYLQPMEDQEFDLPVLIENPARHAGLGSFVVFSNGKHKFFPGREIWNHAQHLAQQHGVCYWHDWQAQQQAFRPLQDASRRVSLESEQMRELFEILQRQEAGR